jgi:hypothetical protein
MSLLTRFHISFSIYGDRWGKESQKQNKSLHEAVKAKSSTLKLDVSNVPEKVEWDLTDGAYPFITG